MDTQNKYRFSGGDNFTGLLKLYHDIMMLNELEGGYGAYELSFAGGKSGLSFGGNQMDMNKNEIARDTFHDVLLNALDEFGNKILLANEWFCQCQTRKS